jgi:tetratricopeptide (TPR) repeat protein
MSAPVPSTLGWSRPFPGLRPFGYSDHGYFFGRTDQTFALYRMVDRSRFVAVVGSSGSGKSSLVFSGLCPLLDRESRDAGGRTWIWREMAPGGVPLERLIDLLDGLAKAPGDNPAAGKIIGSQRDRIAYLIRTSSHGLVQALGEIENLKGKTLLLIIDQFEELFRYATSAQSRSHNGELLSREESVLFVELLIEASRSPECDVRVMLTLRSDFIGDCARFHDLPEAVSETQFLVPSLTRIQREEIIRKPIEKANATIDPMLVERLLNDNSEDMDQLPVLQHCLLRLWDEAGREASAVEASPPRHLTLEHYQAIGGMDGALSRHANEILGVLPGLELAVQLVFRALAEFDKDGRAIRRAVSFEQLLAETGLLEADLRTVLDRFRDADCSFLRPVSPQRLESDTLIDVGHEALLRRWERVSGKPSVSPGAAVADAGWLAVEKRDAEIYHSLLARAKDEDPLPFRQVRRRLGWWATPGHTRAWAERYGGGFAQVKTLLDKSQLGRRIWTVAIVLGVLGTSGGGVWGYQFYAKWQHDKGKMLHDAQEAAQKALEDAQKYQRAVESYRRAVDSQSAFLGGVLKALNRGTISVAGADGLLNDVQKAIDNEARGELKGDFVLASRDAQNSPDIVQTESGLMIVRSDIYVAQKNYRKALAEVEAAWRRIGPIFEQNKKEPKWIRLAYNCKLRIGDAYADSELNRQPGYLDRAFEVYSDGLTYAEQLAEIQPDRIENKIRISVIRGKLGDVRLTQEEFAGARAEYEKGLAVARAVASAAPEEAVPRRELASAITRIGWLLERQEKFDEALLQFQAALDIRKELAVRDANDDVVQSHVAESHRAIGNVFRKLDRPKDALAEYLRSVEIWEMLLRKDVQNMAWPVGLGKVLPAMADAYKSEKNRQGELESYGKAFINWSNLAARDRTQTEWQQRAATIGEIYGALLGESGKSAEAIGVYRDVVDARKSLTEIYPADLLAKRDLFIAYLKLGDRLLLANDRNAAADRYGAALAIAVESVRTNSSDGSWQQDLAMVRGRLAPPTEPTGAVRGD